MIRVAVGGAAGRMGSLIAQLALDDHAFRVVGALESPGHPALGQDLGQTLGRASTQVIITEEFASATADADVLIEFTVPEATLAHAKAAAARRVPMVIGTTGLTPAQMDRLKACAAKTPIFWSPNMSLGVLLLRRLLAESAEFLKAVGLDRTVKFQLSETHHVHKKDAPSGTAKQLRDDLAASFRRPAAQLAIESKREGEIVGLHRVQLTIGDERLVLEHEALSRAIFARGALVVAKFLGARGRKPGFYTMDTFAKWSLSPGG